MTDGRRCAEDGCETILSRFNTQRWCSPHARLHPPTHAGNFAGSPRGRARSAPESEYVPGQALGQADGSDSSPSSEEPKPEPRFETFERNGRKPVDKLTLEDAAESLREQLEALDAEEEQAKITLGRIAQKRSQLQRAVNALDDIVGNPGKFDCPDCGRPCRNARSLSNHRTRMHKEAS